jgi:hypothetical protein
MLRFFLFMVGVMAASASVAGESSPCPGGTAPIQIQIMNPENSGSKLYSSVAAIPFGLPHFRAFVESVTNHINARLAKKKLCVAGARDMESMDSATIHNRSLLQFVRWQRAMSNYATPAITDIKGRPPPSCRIFSPWIDLVLERTPAPSIRGVVYWNERQLLADQAVLAGARNVPPGRVKPMKPSEYGYFMGEFMNDYYSEPLGKPPSKLIEKRLPPDYLWLLRRAWQPGMGMRTQHFPGSNEAQAMIGVEKESAEGYTKLVITLVDRCFASGGKRAYYYRSILDVDDPVLLEQYKIDSIR